MSKNKPNRRQRQALETIGKQAHTAMSEAKRLQDARQFQAGYFLAQSVWKLVIFTAFKRKNGRNVVGTAKFNATNGIRYMKSQALIPENLANELKVADRIATMGPESESEIVQLIDTGLHLLEFTEPHEVRRQRMRSERPARRWFGLRVKASA
jgi:hypothetical protein